MCQELLFTRNTSDPKASSLTTFVIAAESRKRWINGLGMWRGEKKRVTSMQDTYSLPVNIDSEAWWMRKKAGKNGTSLAKRALRILHRPHTTLAPDSEILTNKLTTRRNRPCWIHFSLHSYCPVRVRQQFLFRKVSFAWYPAPMGNGRKQATNGTATSLQICTRQMPVSGWFRRPAERHRSYLAVSGVQCWNRWSWSKSAVLRYVHRTHN